MYSQAHPEVCLLGDPESRQVDREEEASHSVIGWHPASARQTPCPIVALMFLLPNSTRINGLGEAPSGA